MGFLKSIGNAITRPIRGLGRIARGKFREGFGDIGAGAKAAAPILGASGVGLPLAAGIGATLLEQWNFEDQFVTAAREAEKWGRQVEQADYCDIVQVAQLHCTMVGGAKIDGPPLIELPAFKRLHLDEIDPVKVVEEARQEISEIVSLLAA